MVLLPAHDHLSPPASALPLPQYARAWKRFISATHIYVAVRAWYQWRREGFAGSHWSNGKGYRRLRLTQEGAPAGRYPSE
jgi:hypothetical protein